ncbi:RNA polymerase sigma factor [Profundibacter amoris]|uniref:RNA polymerase sigma factor n=1 Tax=Profundibacter amoris TaxID=2171755 RepID=A0A347ULF5_9RHOB|nr:RNA polymerase sigma factor [Profundibacter amoris]AXX99683.1 RNA polymerase sigma factor [Profundibacter amoris]
MPEFRSQLQDCLPDLWRYAYALTRDRNMADDLVQDCAERALRKRDLWKQTGALKPWLMKMLLNLYRNQLRTQSRRPQLVAMDDMHHDPAAPDALDQKLALSQTARAMKKLPDDQREALLLIVLGGVSYKQAAVALNVPLGTLMSRLGRARAKLRELMADAPTADLKGAS